MKPFSLITAFLRQKKHRIIVLEGFLLLTLCGSLLFFRKISHADAAAAESPPEASYIKWVDFDVTNEALRQAFRYDVDTCQAPIHLNWVNLLAYLGTRYGGDFSKYKPEHMDAVAKQLKEGTATMESLTAGMKHYAYYREAYGAVLDGMVGTFQAEIPAEQAPASYLPAGTSPAAGETIWVTKYGLKAFGPLAKNFPYSDFDDFGASRSYGFKRQHLGHDLMGQVGTPVIAVESGMVEAIGWNQYGGWRLGIRSFDKKRYYYYAHLRKNHPYQTGLETGTMVQAGDVIGYLGRTGYSAKENTNNIDDPHLHFGLELVFDESQKDSNHEVWVSCYELVKFLNLNRCETAKIEGTKEWRRIYQTKDMDARATPSQAALPEPTHIAPAD